MTASPCPRLFQVEAMRDGRLGGAELARFGRHLTACPACTREAQALQALAERLRPADDPGSADADELRACRERTRLLAAFDRAQIAPARRWRSPRLLWPAAAAAVAAVAAVGFVSWRARPASQSTGQLAAVVHSDATAVWSEHAEGERKTIVLERGALWIHVDHPAQQPATPAARGAARFVVVLPDGELEDLGTTFTISAEDGHTTRVAVQEGSVVLRLRDQPPVAIGAGQTWIPGPRPAAGFAPRVEPPAAAQAAARPSPSPEPAPSPRRPSSAPEIARPDPSLVFRAAMAALHAGDNREAAAGFASFLARHSRDPRAEDAAYLRVLALQRCRAPADMRSAAQDYLRRFPAGFRRAEVERLARPPDEAAR